VYGIVKYDNPELLERLAAEYVLGTLRGKARDRFIAILRTLPAARTAVWRWESRLHDFQHAAPETWLPLPEEKVWQRIRSQLRMDSASVQSNVVPLTRIASRASDSTRIWKGLTALATAAVVLLAVMLVRNPATPVSGAEHVAVFSDQQQEPQWLVSIDRDTGMLTARAVNAQAAGAGKAFELWMLPGGSAPPRSLGLLPVAHQVLHARLPRATMSMLPATTVLAVSLEPSGGSPTGLPGGPVLYQAPLLRL
jgi:anti-sigma-K factor RskA